jgi:hypothetical protein
VDVDDRRVDSNKYSCVSSTFPTARELYQLVWVWSCTITIGKQAAQTRTKYQAKEIECCWYRREPGVLVLLRCTPYMILKWRVVVVVCVYYFSNFNVLSLAKKRDGKGRTSAHVRNRSEVRMSAHNKIVLENLRVDQALLSFSRSLDEKCFVVVVRVEWVWEKDRKSLNKKKSDVACLH